MLSTDTVQGAAASGPHTAENSMRTTRQFNTTQSDKQTSISSDTSQGAAASGPHMTTPPRSTSRRSRINRRGARGGANLPMNTHGAMRRHTMPGESKSSRRHDSLGKQYSTANAMYDGATRSRSPPKSCPVKGADSCDAPAPAPRLQQRRLRDAAFCSGASVLCDASCTSASVLLLPLHSCVLHTFPTRSSTGLGAFYTVLHTFSTHFLSEAACPPAILNGVASQQPPAILCVVRIHFRASFVFIFILFILFIILFFLFLPGGGAGRRSLLWHLTDVPRTTYTHDTVGNPEDIALGKKKSSRQATPGREAAAQGRADGVVGSVRLVRL